MSDARILLTVIGTEFSKLKRCKVLWAIPICSLVPDILVFVIYSFNEKYSIVAWEDYIKYPIMIINLFLGIGALSLNIIIMNTKFNTLFPWSIPTIFSPHENGMTFTNYPLGCAVLCLCFLGGSLLSIKSIRSDVH